MTIPSERADEPASAFSGAELAQRSRKPVMSATGERSQVQRRSRKSLRPNRDKLTLRARAGKRKYRSARQLPICSRVALPITNEELEAVERLLGRELRLLFSRKGGAGNANGS